VLGPVTVGNALRRACEGLEVAGVEDARLNAELLLAHTLGVPRLTLHARPETPLAGQEHSLYCSLVARRARREPLAYILQRWEFYGLEFIVTPAVLVPRPETETLVEAAVRWLQARGHTSCAPTNQATGARPLLIADVGTGSGCTAVALARQFPAVSVFAVDTSPEALEVAGRNARRHGVERRVVFLQGHLVGPLPEPVDLMVANLPYISETDFPGLQPEIRCYEPRGSLVAREGGLALNRALLGTGASRLRSGGVLFLEFSPPQRERLERAARQCFPGAQITVLKDMGGLDRVLAVEPRSRES